MPEKNSILSSLLKPLIAAQCRLPKMDGEIKLAGLQAPVEVRRDHKGVPHIYASNTLDTFYAQGYIHAQERLWQMEFNRRLVAGRLSEMLGQLTLPLDRWMRTLTMRRVAEFEVSLYNAASTALLQAYADGVNAFIKQGPTPVEFKLICKPEPWIIADILAWVKMMAWSLSVNWEMELLRAKFIDRFGSELAAELEAPHLERWQYTIPPGSDFSNLDVTALERARSARPFTGPSPYEGLGRITGSSGSRTTTASRCWRMTCTWRSAYLPSGLKITWSAMNSTSPV
jgi:penicillin amidase